MLCTILSLSYLSRQCALHNTSPSLTRAIACCALSTRKPTCHVHSCIPAFLRWEWPEFRLDGRSGRPCRPPGRRHITEHDQHTYRNGPKKSHVTTRDGLREGFPVHEFDGLVRASALSSNSVVPDDLQYSTFNSGMARRASREPT